MPSQLQTARTSRRRLSLPSSTVNKPLKRARNSDPTAAATQNDDYYGTHMSTASAGRQICCLSLKICRELHIASSAISNPCRHEKTVISA